MRVRSVAVAALSIVTPVVSGGCGVSTAKLHYMEDRETDICAVQSVQGDDGAAQATALKANVEAPEVGLTVGDVLDFLESRCK